MVAVIINKTYQAVATAVENIPTVSGDVSTSSNLV